VASRFAQRENLLTAAITSNKQCYLSTNTSTTTTPPPPPPPQQQQRPNAHAPTAVTADMAISITKILKQYITNGLTHKRLLEISQQGEVDIVFRWQSMMESFLSTQAHILAGFGYDASEAGIGLYGAQMGHLMQSGDLTSAEVEDIQASTRDAWCTVLQKAFNISEEEFQNSNVVDMDIVKARDMMHLVSSRIQAPEVLEKMASIKDMEALPEKHTALQKILVHDVYLGGTPSLLQQCGFETSEKGYVLMQCTLSKHQNDPLIAQYVGGAMMRAMEAAGIPTPGSAPPK